MSISAHQVHLFLDKYPLHLYGDDLESFLEEIHYIYISSNPINSDEIRAHFHKINDILDVLSFADANTVFSHICDLCYLHEYLAFSHGMSVGIRIMQEINKLP